MGAMCLLNHTTQGGMRDEQLILIVLPFFQATHEDTTQSLRQEIAELRLRLKDVDALGNQSNDTGSKVRAQLPISILHRPLLDCQ